MKLGPTDQRLGKWGGKMNRRFGLKTLFVLVGLIALALAVYRWDQNSERSSSIRNDLQLTDDQRLDVVFTETLSTVDPWATREKAIVVVDIGDRYRLAELHREMTSSDPDVFEWSVGSVRTRESDGTYIWRRFLRDFDHRPTITEVDDFRDWVAQW